MEIKCYRCLVKIRPSEFETFCADCAIAILNGDRKRIDQICTECSRELLNPFLPPELDPRIEDYSEPGEVVSIDDEDLDQYDPEDPLAGWLLCTELRGIFRAQKELQRLVDSWIAAYYRIEKWTEADQFKRFLKAREIVFYYGKPRLGLKVDFRISDFAPGSHQMRWLFFNVVTGYYCRRIGRCAREGCRKYFVYGRGRFCCPQCSRWQSAKDATKRRRRCEHDWKMWAILEAAKELELRIWASEGQWMERLLERACKKQARKGQADITSNFLTRHIGEIPRPRFQS